MIVPDASDLQPQVIINNNEKHGPSCIQGFDDVIHDIDDGVLPMTTPTKESSNTSALRSMENVSGAV